MRALSPSHFGFLSFIASLAAGCSDSMVTCPIYSEREVTGYVSHPAVIEASGIASSRKNPDVLWVHNDAGGLAQIYGLSTTGAVKGTYDLPGVTAEDWEDIAVGPGLLEGETYIYIGDIGDNDESRGSVRIYRAREPMAVDGATATTLTGIEQLKLEYPEKTYDAETLLIDPLNGDLYLVAKNSSGKSPVFRAAAPLAFGGTMTLEKVTTLTFGEGFLPGDTKTTGGDISPSGDTIAIRTYDSAFVWRRQSGMTIAEALKTTPCAIPVAQEKQGEALGFKADGSGYFTLSEGVVMPIHFYARQ